MRILCKDSILKEIGRKIKYIQHGTAISRLSEGLQNILAICSVGDATEIISNHNIRIV